MYAAPIMSMCRGTGAGWPGVFATFSEGKSQSGQSHTRIHTQIHPIMATKGKQGKKGTTAGASLGGLCANPRCRKPGAGMLCNRCRRVVYCNHRCQKAHWGPGGHKKFCHPPFKPSSSAQPAQVPGSTGTRTGPHTVPTGAPTADDEHEFEHE